MNSPFSCGAARAEITPEASWYPMYPGFFTEEIHDNYLVGALDPQYVRAIAVRNADTTVLFVSFDLGAVPCGPKMAKLLSQETGVPEERIFLTATHTHNVAALGHREKLMDNPMFLRFREARPEIAEHHLLYERRIWDGAVSAAKEALASLRSARLGIGYANSYVNVNRDQLYAGGWGMGFNAEGHSDKTLAVIRFEDGEGRPIALIANYAVHAIVMFLNRCLHGKGGTTGDLPGVVSNAYETNHPGAVCMWTPAANGNQNPIIMTYYGYPDFATGRVYESTVEGGAYEFLTVLAARHYADLLRAEGSIADYADNIDLRAVREAVEVPARTDIPPRFGPGPDDRPGFQRIWLSGLTLGDIFFYGIGGELYSDVGARLKALSPFHHTLICSQCYTTAGYMMGDEALLAPTLFAQRTRWVPGTLVPALEGFLKRFEK